MIKTIANIFWPVIKKTGLTIIVLLLFRWSQAPTQAQAPQPAPDVRTALASGSSVRVVVALQPTGGDRTSAQQVARTQDQALYGLSKADFHLLHRFETLPGLVGEVSEAGLEALIKRPEVAAVALDLPVRAAATGSAVFINADDVFNEYGFTGTAVNIAVLDTGLDINHSDLAGRIVAQRCFSHGQCLPNAADDSENAQDENGHGTHVAGIIASQGEASPRGIAPDSGLVAVRVLGSNGSGYTSDVLAGLDWVTANQDMLEVDLINLSLGGGSYEGTCDQVDATTMLYAAAVERARTAGIVLFAASGNSGQPDKMMAPACVSGVMAVGNVYDTPLSQLGWPGCVDQDIETDQVPCSSNSSTALDLLAPGVSVVSTSLGGGQSSKSGTSMSVPHAVAVAALMLEADPNLSVGDVEETLRETGVAVTDQRTGRITPRIDALAAVSQVASSEAVTLSGGVHLEGRVDHSGVTILLADEFCVPLITNQPAAVTLMDGRFEIALPVDHQFQCLQAVHPGYLSGQRAGLGGDLGTITLSAGDVTGDGKIDIFDLAYIAAHYQGDDPLADLTADGLVDIFDLALAANNYEREGVIDVWE